jgi:nitroimidazol reductase NimA-like FMN-containing flavoprotein (pyridoxamine 5'-phosphate oxidase superfamily)
MTTLRNFQVTLESNEFRARINNRRFDELTRDECLKRLAGRTIGRLAVMVNHYPQVFVVNYRLDDFIVVFRTHAGTKLNAANHANVSFQVDQIDEISRSGWSVLIQGMAEDVTDRVADPVSERSRNLGVQPWVPGEKPRLVRIIPARITGRELVPVDVEDSSDDIGYL